MTNSFKPVFMKNTRHESAYLREPGFKCKLLRWKPDWHRGERVGGDAERERERADVKFS